MTRRVYEEHFHAYWVPGDDGIADIEAPTEEEIEAGVNYTGYIPRDGFKFGTSENRVDNSDIASEFDSELIGTWGSSLEVTFKRGDGVDDDEPWDDIDRKDQGFWVIVPFGAAADGMKAQVYPCEAGQGRPMDTAANEQQKFVRSFAVTSEPALKAVVGGAS
jgi:hypothetical protein